MSFLSKVPANTNQVKNLLSTSLVSGCTVTVSAIISGVTATVTIAKGVLRYVDNHTDATLPNFKGDKSFSEVITTLVDISVTRSVLIDENLAVTFPVFTGTDGPEERRDRIQLGAIAAVSGAFIPAISMIGYDTIGLLKDHGEAYGTVRRTGLRLRSNGANLGFKRTSGEQFTPFYTQFFTDTKDPTSEDLSEQSPVNHFTIWQDGSGGFNRAVSLTVLTPAVFDDGTGGASAPNGTVNNNSAQILRVYEVFGSIGILYGQTVYNSIAAAVLAIPSEVFNLFFGFINTAFRGFIVVRGGATDLSLGADAQFFDPASDFVTVRED